MVRDFHTMPAPMSPVHGCLWKTIVAGEFEIENITTSLSELAVYESACLWHRNRRISGTEKNFGKRIIASKIGLGSKVGHGLQYLENNVWNAVIRKIWRKKMWTMPIFRCPMNPCRPIYFHGSQWTENISMKFAYIGCSCPISAAELEHAVTLYKKNWRLSHGQNQRFTGYSTIEARTERGRKKLIALIFIWNSAISRQLSMATTMSKCLRWMLLFGAQKQLGRLGSHPPAPTKCLTQQLGGVFAPINSPTLMNNNEK